MRPADVRESVIARLEEDLVGPHSVDEVLEGPRVRPSDVYLTGILWPIGERMGGSDDDGSNGDDEGDEAPSTASPVGQQKPCTMGVSFCVQAIDGPSPVDVTIHFATYSLELVDQENGESPLLRWTRKPYHIPIPHVELPVDGHVTREIKADGLDACIELHIRARRGPSSRLVTATLINRSCVANNDRNASEQLMLFQARLTIVPSAGTRIVPRPGRPSANDEDEEVGRLLYRNAPEFATGHQCSASWEAAGAYASLVSSEWIPRAAVPALREDGDEVFAALVRDGSLDAQAIAAADESNLLASLARLPSAYDEWISKTRASKRAQDLPDHLRPIAERNLAVCERIRDRMRGGVEAIRRDSRLRLAFQLANAAMALQHSWKLQGGASSLRWRPFQLGFILLAAESTCCRSAPARDILDLLWFPTGGGKTEAYLALIAMLAFYRRMEHRQPDEGRGNAAVMRYTLRLLTAQQFERASALVLACEILRRNKAPNLQMDCDWGNTPFSIGLWVGGDATPNRFSDALERRGKRDGATAEQIEECPCCHGKVRWDYDRSRETVAPYCEGEGCLLARSSFGLWPVFTVDSDIYREQPTLVIGTIDKFALLTTKEEVGSLFGFGTPRATDLIVQDELHLIAGPLGTIAGVYETAFDWLLRKGDHRPKIIGSTATIRRASHQVRALFDRESCQFPPPGIDHDDSGFAVIDAAKPPRIYLGVTTAGRSAKFALQAAAGTLLQSAGGAMGLTDAERDGYSTLLAYFNSLRELGGAIVQMLDDVPDSIRLYASLRHEHERALGLPRELTSRVSQKEIVEILTELKIEAGRSGAIDVVLATNMVSVGVDVSRLGAMLLNGQPKTRSEYIQATSRVGRKTFPGLVVAVLNAAKPRDRSHFETFRGWHASLYRDVEATSVTPFASRARDRALHAALVAMIRHGAEAMLRRPDLARAPDSLLATVVEEIERRVRAIDVREETACAAEIDERLRNWQDRAPQSYNNPHQPNKSLLISADLEAQRRATGRLPAAAWPTMNNMRSIEAATRFRMAEVLAMGKDSQPVGAEGTNQPDAPTPPAAPRWRRTNG